MNRAVAVADRARTLLADACASEVIDPDDPPEEPSDWECAPAEPSDLEPVPAGDESNWDVFIPDDDDCDPLPDLRDFWISESAE